LETIDELGAPFCALTADGSSAPFVTKESTCFVYSRLLDEFLNLFQFDSGVNMKANIYGQALRVAFHDAGEVNITDSNDKLGPDGCLSTAINNLDMFQSTSTVMSKFEPIWQKYCNLISRADFWVLFAKFSIERGDSTGTINIPFSFGRKDAKSCVSPTTRLPDAQGSLESAVDQVFVKQMGLSLDDAGRSYSLPIYSIRIIVNFLNLKYLKWLLLGRILLGMFMSKIEDMVLIRKHQRQIQLFHNLMLGTQLLELLTISYMLRH
jgi:hypothetical protein